MYCQYFSGYIQQDVNQKIFDIAKKNLSNFFFVGEYENFKDDIKKLMLKLDIDYNEILNINDYKRKSAIQPSIEEMNIIKFHNNFDIELYKSYKDKKKIL